MGLHEIPVVSRTQRRHERRQRLLMLVLAGAVAAACFFLGVMVGERSTTAAYSRQMDAYQPAVQVAPPPPVASQLAAAQKIRFYDDLPKGNAAPLGSGINLPRAGDPPSASAPPPTATVPEREAVAAAPAPVAEPPPAVKAAPTKALAAPAKPEVKAKPAAPAVAQPAPAASSGGGREVPGPGLLDQERGRCQTPGRAAQEEGTRRLHRAGRPRRPGGLVSGDGRQLRRPGGGQSGVSAAQKAGAERGNSQ